VNVERLLVRHCEVVRRHPDGEDVYGNVTMVDEVTATRCYAEQRRSAEPAAAGERAVSDWLVMLPAGIDVTIADAIRPAGAPSLEVVGDPWAVHNPRLNQTSHIELLARETG